MEGCQMTTSMNSIQEEEGKGGGGAVSQARARARARARAQVPLPVPLPGSASEAQAQARARARGESRQVSSPALLAPLSRTFTPVAVGRRRARALPLWSSSSVVALVVGMAVVVVSLMSGTAVGTSAPAESVFTVLSYDVLVSITKGKGCAFTQADTIVLNFTEPTEVGTVIYKRQYSISSTFSVLALQGELELPSIPCQPVGTGADTLCSFSFANPSIVEFTISYTIESATDADDEDNPTAINSVALSSDVKYNYLLYNSMTSETLVSDEPIGLFTFTMEMSGANEPFDPADVTLGPGYEFEPSGTGGVITFSAEDVSTSTGVSTDLTFPILQDCGTPSVAIIVIGAIVVTLICCGVLACMLCTCCSKPELDLANVPVDSSEPMPAKATLTSVGGGDSNLSMGSPKTIIVNDSFNSAGSGMMSGNGSVYAHQTVMTYNDASPSVMPMNGGGGMVMMMSGGGSMVMPMGGGSMMMSGGGGSMNNGMMPMGGGNMMMPMNGGGSSSNLMMPMNGNMMSAGGGMMLQPVNNGSVLPNYASVVEFQPANMNYSQISSINSVGMGGGGAGGGGQFVQMNPVNVEIDSLMDEILM